MFCLRFGAIDGVEPALEFGDDLSCVGMRIARSTRDQLLNVLVAMILTSTKIQVDP